MMLRQGGPRVEMHVCGEVTCGRRGWFVEGEPVERDAALAELGRQRGAATTRSGG